MESSSQGQEVALAREQEAVMTEYCAWCQLAFGSHETKVHLDGSKFHGNCAAIYERNKGKPLLRVLKESA